VLHYGLHWDVTHEDGTWEFDKVRSAVRLFFLFCGRGRAAAPPSRSRPSLDSSCCSHHRHPHTLTYENKKKTPKQHWYTKFDVMSCPPWDLDSKRPVAGLFPPPPHPTKLRKTVRAQSVQRGGLCFAVCVFFSFRM
jgi:hypothetical protein